MSDERANYIQFKYKCTIPGCPRYVLSRAYHLCKPCWEQYGGVGWQKKPWLRWLINQAEREKHAQDRDEARTVSLEHMLFTGQMRHEQVVPYKSAPRKIRQRKQRYRGRPRKK